MRFQKTALAGVLVAVILALAPGPASSGPCFSKCKGIPTSNTGAHQGNGGNANAGVQDAAHQNQQTFFQIYAQITDDDRLIRPDQRDVDQQTGHVNVPPESLLLRDQTVDALDTLATNFAAMSSNNAAVANQAQTDFAANAKPLAAAGITVVPTQEQLDALRQLTNTPALQNDTTSEVYQTYWSYLKENYVAVEMLNYDADRARNITPAGDYDRVDEDQMKVVYDIGV